MTPDLIIVSVPHTGTRFLKKRLGIEDHIHSNSNWEKLWDTIDGRYVIAPLRSPPTVWRSWCRRHANRDPLEWVGHFMAGWFALNALDQMIDVDMICVDKQEDPRIDDWQPVGEFEGRPTDWKLHKVDLRTLYNLPIVYRNYGGRPNSRGFWK